MKNPDDYLPTYLLDNVALLMILLE